jgi:hypothetical protein
MGEEPSGLRISGTDCGGGVGLVRRGPPPAEPAHS